MIWFYLLLGLTLLIILSLFIRIYTTIYYLYKGDTNILRVEVKMIGIKIVNREINMVESENSSMTMKKGNDISTKDQEKSNTSKYTPHELLSQFKKIKSLLGRVISFKSKTLIFLSKIKIHQMHWNTKVGTGDASVTGVISGAIWAVKGSIIGLLVRYMNFNVQPNIHVTPYFQQKLAYTELECIFSVRLGQTIYAIIQMIRHFQGSGHSWTSEAAQ
ncbi:DUF2953 domain-containing protein [Aquibacillus saliphilus]|uniref:DUF2953 domain-containing protein n=1 Tax=Aquibacillus saliphilus TaxID=1909422 RepID=UPI001CF04731|nr:DUF2953 domain-containing protein [Aquibacillus saliphilus]